MTDRKDGHRHPRDGRAQRGLAAWPVPGALSPLLRGRRVATLVATMKTAKKVSVSIQADLLAAITRRAKRLYGGNISAVIAEMGEDVKRLDAMDRYFEKYRIAPLTDGARARLSAELAAPVPAPKTKRKKTS